MDELFGAGSRSANGGHGVVMRCQSCGFFQADAPRCERCHKDQHALPSDRRPFLWQSVSAHPWISTAFIIAALLIFGNVRHDAPMTNVSQRPVVTASPSQRGEEVRLAAEGMTTVLLARDREAFEELTTAFLAANTKGYVPLVMAALIESGRLLVVEPNTKAVALEADQVKTRVRIVSGRDAGADGWVFNFQIMRQ